MFLSTHYNTLELAEARLRVFSNEGRNFYCSLEWGTAMVQKQLSFDLPSSQPLSDRDRLHNRLALGTQVVTPESRDDSQHELFAIHSRIAEDDGHFGHRPYG